MNWFSILRRQRHIYRCFHHIFKVNIRSLLYLFCSCLEDHIGQLVELTNLDRHAISLLEFLKAQLLPSHFECVLAHLDQHVSFGLFILYCLDLFRKNFKHLRHKVYRIIALPGILKLHSLLQEFSHSFHELNQIFSLSFCPLNILRLQLYLKFQAYTSRIQILNDVSSIVLG